MIDKIHDRTPEAEARQIEAAFDELQDAALRCEAAALNRQGSEADTAEAPDPAAFALRPEQRMAAWAAARSPDEHGQLGLGRYLRCMTVGAKTDAEKRALSEGSDSAGGFTVPTSLSARLIDLLRAESVVVRAGAQTVPLESDNHSIAALAADPTPAWRAENASIAESDPTFRKVAMTPRSLAVMTKVSRELLQDSLNLEAELPRILAAALATELDRVALLGSGTAPEPEGIANVSGIGTLALAGALTGYSPLVKARTAIATANAGAPSAIVMHPRDAGTLAELTASDGQPLAMPRALESVPMLTTTSIPVDGGAGSDESTIISGNFRHLLVGIRSDIRVEVLRDPFADVHQYGLVAHMRADVAVEHAGAFHVVSAVTG